MKALRILLAIMAGMALLSACTFPTPQAPAVPTPYILPPGESPTVYVPTTIPAMTNVPPTIAPSPTDYVPVAVSPTEYVPGPAPATVYVPPTITPTVYFAPTTLSHPVTPHSLGTLVLQMPFTSINKNLWASPTPTAKKVYILVPNSAGQQAVEAKYSALGGAGGFLGAPKEPVYKAPDGVGYYEYFQNGAIYWHPDTGAFEIHGLILAKWVELGWEQGFLGYPLTDESTTPDGVGRYNHFQGGSIYWTPDTGAHEVHGDIRAKWSSLGWEQSILGYPLTDESITPDGNGRYNHFQGGSIYWTPQTGAHEIHGAIREKWSWMGWEQSVLGYPTTDESATPDGNGRYNHFAGGSIYWTPQTGAIPVLGQIRDKWASMGWEQGCLGYPKVAEEAGADGFRSQWFQGGKVFVYKDGSVKAQCGFDTY